MKTPSFLDSRKIVTLPVGAIKPNPHQPRRRFLPEDLAELSDSIRRYGDRLFALHLKNVVPDVVDKATGKLLKRNQARPFPRGDIDLVAIAQALKDIGYTGTCEIEYERDYTDNLSGMAENIGYFRGIMDSLR